MKPRLVVLSDLWGKEKSNWLESYIKNLKSTFEIQYYDCCDLAGIDISDYQEDILHKQFVNGGIDRAVDQLLKIETYKINILSFSIGGTIAWKAGLKGLDINYLFTISSTRLRKETETPLGVIHLYFAENDLYKPSEEWFEKMHLKAKIFKNTNHEMYKDQNIANKICFEIIKELNE